MIGFSGNDTGSIDEELLSQKAISTIVGSVICGVGFVLNLFILAVFRTYSRQTPNSYILQALACCDIGVLVGYVLMFPLDILSQVNQDYRGYHLWVRSVALVYPFSRFFQMTTSYITIMAAFERFITFISTKKANRLFHGTKTFIWIATIMGFALLSHISRYWEIHVTVNTTYPETSMYYLEAGGSDFRTKYYYKIGYSLWYSNISNTVLPFLALVILTGLNVFMLKRHRASYRGGKRIALRKKSIAKGGTTKDRPLEIRRRRLRDSAMVLIVLVITYLVLNSLSFVLGILEFVSTEFLEENRHFYTTAVDIINICAIFNSSCRLGNYLTFNLEFRENAKERCCGGDLTKIKEMSGKMDIQHLAMPLVSNGRLVDDGNSPVIKPLIVYKSAPIRKCESD